ncbi:MAG: MliC family protein [Candidatus Paceibacterota bacterium]|jgi:membrane-bound inhibitor of C-type lysozyme
MTIEWNKVTRLSQIVAIILFVAVFFCGFLIGRKFENKSVLGEAINNVKFACVDDKTISASFYKNFVHIKTDELGSVYLPQTISASGARYANSNESIVFWNKADTAFITEGDPNTPTYEDCVII